MYETGEVEGRNDTRKSLRIYAKIRSYGGWERKRLLMLSNAEGKVIRVVNAQVNAAAGELRRLMNIHRRGVLDAWMFCGELDRGRIESRVMKLYGYPSLELIIALNE